MIILLPLLLLTSLVNSIRLDCPELYDPSISYHQTCWNQIISKNVTKRQSNQKYQINIGLILEKYFLGRNSSISQVLLEALQFHANQQFSNLIPQAEIKITNNLFDGDEVDLIPAAIQATNEAIRRDKAVALLGTWMSQTTSYVAIAANNNIPRTAICSGSATSIELNQRNLYYNFFRSVPDDTEQARALIAFIQSRGWTRFSMIYSNDQYGDKLATTVQIYAQKAGIYILDVVPLSTTSPGASLDYTGSISRLSQSGASVFLAIAYTDQMIGILTAAKARNILRAGYAWLGTDSNKVQWANYTEIYARLFPGLIITAPLRCQQPQCAEFELQWASAPKNLYPSAGTPLPPFGYYYLDCLSNIGYGLIQFMKNQSRSWEVLAAGGYNQDLVLPGVQTTWSFPNIQGYTSNLGLESTGSPDDTIYAFFNWQNKSLVKREAISPYEDHWIQVGTWSPTEGLKMDPKATIYYPPGNVTTTPPDLPQDPQCNPGTGAVNSTNGGRICVPCAVNYFNRDTSSNCWPCPEGAYCPGGTQVYAKNGWWMDPSTAFQPFPVLYSCQRATQCCDLEYCNLTTQCPGGHIGILCSECPDGLYSWGNTCVPCNPAINAGIAIAVFVAAVVFLIIVILLSRTSNVIVSEISFFFQVAYLILDDSVSTRFLGLLALNTDGLNGSDSSPVCVFPLTDWGKMMFNFFYPTALLVIYFLIWGCCLFWSRYLKPRVECCVKCVPKKIREMDIAIMFRTGAVLVLLFVYLPFVRSSLNTFNCRDVAGEYVVRAHPSVVCWQGRHIAAVIISCIFLLACVIGTPIVLSMVVRRISMAEQNNIDPYTDLAYYPSVYHLEKYRKPRRWWFSIGQLVERTVIILVSVAFAFDEFAYEQAFDITFIIGVCCLLVVWPYSAWQDNVFKGVNYMAWSGILFVRVFRRTSYMTIYAREQQYSLTLRILESIYIIVPVIIFLYLAWFQWGHIVVRAGTFVIGRLSTLRRKKKPVVVVATADEHGIVEAKAVDDQGALQVRDANRLELGKASHRQSVIVTGSISGESIGITETVEPTESLDTNTDSTHTEIIASQPVAPTNFYMSY